MTSHPDGARPARPAEQGSPQHSYDMRALDPGAEIPRLEQQVALVTEIERAHLERLGLPLDATIVDLGCGPGFLSVVLAERVPGGRVVCVDADEDLLTKVRARFTARGLPNGETVRAWADAVPLPSGTADLVYARFLLQHVPNPGAVLTEARRLAKPGGRIVVVDTDDGGLVVHPEPPGLAALLDASRASQAALGGDRHVGRKLRGLFVAAGLEAVRVEVEPITSDLVGMERFLDLTLGYKRQIIDRQHLSPEAIEAVLRSVYALAADPGAFAHALGYVAVGTVPAGG